MGRIVGIVIIFHVAPSRDMTFVIFHNAGNYLENCLGIALKEHSIHTSTKGVMKLIIYRVANHS